jgi:hypothetical protein
MTDSLYVANEQQNPPLSEYRKELKLYTETRPLEQEMTDHDQLLSAAQSNATQYTVLAKNLLKDPPLLDPAYQYKKSQVYDQAVAASGSKVVKLQNQLDINRERYKMLEENILALDRTRNIRKGLASAACQDNQALKGFVHTRDRLVDINQAAALKKQSMISRLGVIIYLIIYAMALGVAMAMGILPATTFGYLILAGSIVALYFIFSSHGGEILKTYGDVSMNVAKDAVRDVVGVIGWDKTCPKRCQPKHPKGPTHADFDPSDDLRSKSCPPMPKGINPNMYLNYVRSQGY